MPEASQSSARYEVDEETEEEVQKDSFLNRFIHQRPSWWKKFVFVSALYNLAFVPFRICLNEYATLPEVIVDLFLDAVMMSEFICNLVSTPVDAANPSDSDDQKFYKFSNVLVNMRSTTSILELFALFPLDLVGLGIGIPGGLMHPLFRLNKMVRIMQLGWYFDQLGEILQISHNAQRVFRIVILILWMIYWLGCVWNLVVWMDGETTKSWYWTQSPGISQRTAGYRLLMGIYYVLILITGYGSVLPQSDLQIALSMVTVCIGVAGNVGVLGTLGSLVQNLDSSGAAFRQKMDAVSDYMRYRKLSPEMRNRINEYYTYLWQSRRGLDEASLIQQLPVYLQEEVSLFLNKEIISKVPLFHECDEQFKTAVVVKLIPLVLLPDSHIVRKGEVGKEMYFISRGEVQVVSDTTKKEDRIVYATLRDGSFFGEVALLFNDSRRTATVVTSSYCDLFVLRKEDFDSIQESFPDQSKAIQKAAHKRYKLQLENEKDENEKDEEEESEKKED